MRHWHFSAALGGRQPSRRRTHLGQVALVVHGDVAEQVGHGLSVVDAADGFSQNHADVHCLDFGTLELLNFVRDSVGYHHLGGGGVT